MPTVRINIPAVTALDGISAIKPSAVRTDNKELQLIEFTLGLGDKFGFFDPGSVFGQQSADLMLTHFLLSSEDVLPDGSYLSMSPPLWQVNGASFFALRPIFVKGSGLAFDSSEGVMGEGTCLPIPVGHNLSFNTAEVDVGPYVIQMTFHPMPKIDQDCARPPTLAEIVQPPRQD